MELFDKRTSETFGKTVPFLRTLDVIFLICLVCSQEIRIAALELVVVYVSLLSQSNPPSTLVLPQFMCTCIPWVGGAYKCNCRIWTRVSSLVGL